MSKTLPPSNNPIDVSLPQPLPPAPGSSLQGSGEVVDLKSVSTGSMAAATPQAPSSLSQAATPASSDPADTQYWIDLAKNIIINTQDDPYLQTEQLYNLRVEYMKNIHSRELKPKETGL